MYVVVIYGFGRDVHVVGFAAAAWTAAGYHVLGLAPSARAAAELRSLSAAWWEHVGLFPAPADSSAACGRGRHGPYLAPDCGASPGGGCGSPQRCATYGATAGPNQY